jgi:hypothetical protein
MILEPFWEPDQPSRAARQRTATALQYQAWSAERIVPDVSRDLRIGRSTGRDDVTGRTLRGLRAIQCVLSK